MTKQLRGVVVLVAIATAAGGATALAEKVKTGPVKGATYVGVVHDESITVKVAPSGKTATVSLPIAPGFCQGGSGPQRQRTKPGAISKHGTLTAKIAYSAATGSKTVFATVSVKGTFYTFAGGKPVFQGVVKSRFKAAKTCDGQASFQAVIR